MFCVYTLSDSTGIRYVGITQKSLTHRLSRHVSAKKILHKHRWIQKVLKETGQRPIITSIAENLSETEALEIETNKINELKGQGIKLLNIVNGGKGFTGQHTIESKQKISDSKKHLKIKVYQYSKNGDLINSYNSLAEAAQTTKISKAHISKCIRQEKYRKTAGGFVWKTSI